MLDTNETTLSRNSRINKFAQELQLVDVVAAKHGINKPATYKRRNQCIDYMLATANIAELVDRTGILEFGDGKPSADHRALFADVRLWEFFASDAQLVEWVGKR